MLFVHCKSFILSICCKFFYIILDEATRRRLAVTAFAMGVSTRQIEDLLRVILAEDGPDHSTIARWVADQAKQAKPVLEALDAACVPNVHTLDRKAEMWRQQLLPFKHREFVVSDATKGIAAAVEQVADQRRQKDPSASPLEHGLDLFHTTQEVERVLAQEWRRSGKRRKPATPRLSAPNDRAPTRGLAWLKRPAPLGPRRSRSRASRASRSGLASLSRRIRGIPWRGPAERPCPRRDGDRGRL